MWTLLLSSITGSTTTTATTNFIMSSNVVIFAYNNIFFAFALTLFFTQLLTYMGWFYNQLTSFQQFFHRILHAIWFSCRKNKCRFIRDTMFSGNCISFHILYWKTMRETNLVHSNGWKYTGLTYLIYSKGDCGGLADFWTLW